MSKLRRVVVGAPFALTLTGVVLALIMSLPGEAKPRPTVDNPNGDTCFEDPTTDKGADSAIAYCCYDDGCWICGVTPLPGDQCTWDPAYRFVLGQGLLGPPTINPGSFTPLPPRRPRPDLTPNLNPPVIAP